MASTRFVHRRGVSIASCAAVLLIATGAPGEPSARETQTTRAPLKPVPGAPSTSEEPAFKRPKGDPAPDGTRATRVTFGPLALLLGTIAVEFEGSLTDQLSAHFGWALDVLPHIFFVAPHAPIELSLGLRYFPLHRCPEPEGFWLGAGPLVWYGPPAIPGGQISLGYTFVGVDGFTGSFGAGLRTIVFEGIVLITPAIHFNFGYGY